MANKKVSYIQLLKEAITEYDAKVMDYKGPITEPILTYDGEGELETHRNASSILERYYFNEEKEEMVEQNEDVGPENEVKLDDEEDAEDPNEILTGEEADDVEDTMEDLEDELTEDLELEDYEPGDKDIVATDEPLDDEDAAPMSETAQLEHIVIEKLIAEMEEEADGGEAGTDLVGDKEAEKMVEDFDLLEAELEGEGEEDEEKEGEDKDLDIDKEVKKEWKEGAGMGPIKAKAAKAVEEAFRLFKEQVEEEEGKDNGKEEEDDEDSLDEDFGLFEDEDVEDKEEEEKEGEGKEKDLEEDFDIDII